MGNPTTFTNLAVRSRDITAAKVLTAKDSGATFMLNAAAGVAITLPPPKNGLKFKFITKLLFGTSNWVIATTDAEAIIRGSIVVDGAAIPGVAEKQINFVNTADALGDWAEVESDGVSWFVSGVGEAIGSITLTAP